MKKIHVGILISYDYQYAPTCIRQIYNHADRITLAIDVNRRTWNGEKYAMSEDFLKGIKASDPERKIHIYEDDFSIPGLSAMENDTRERNMLAERMGSAEDQWHIQVDSDEYFVDFGAFVSFLHAIEKKVHKPLSVWVEWVTLLKKDPDGFLYVDNASRKEMAVVATNDPHYTAARLNTSLKITNLYCNHRASASKLGPSGNRDIPENSQLEPQYGCRRRRLFQFLEKYQSPQCTVFARFPPVSAVPGNVAYPEIHPRRYRRHHRFIAQRLSSVK